MSVLSPTQVEQVTALVAAAERVDGIAPINEAAMLRLREDTGHFLRTEDGVLAGYAQLHEGSAELVVHPDFRQRGIGVSLGRELVEASGGDLRVWAHGEHPAAVPLAAALGLERTRLLWKFSYDNTAELPEPRFPDGVVVRTFEVGRDESAWLRVNSAAFANHPEQGKWTAADLAARIAEPWFDPKGFFLLTRDDELVGFHWTKAHSDVVGEIYVIGIDPTAHGSGLGTSLALLGLRHLQAQGRKEVILYVEADNDAAVHIYRKLGFVLVATDSEYSTTA
ncbi:MAG: mycothiol synthase [Corynebacteriales bacterium]|nr:mycothiol synthase [Mycobacteriales bacterium]